eukprot:m.508714 g.508714  ORF g.508714 m.508714 type:complete len:344 (-) comp21884_c0_seq3:1779-2810(-)
MHTYHFDNDDSDSNMSAALMDTTWCMSPGLVADVRSNLHCSCCVFTTGNSASDDAESSMISKLKQTCGYEWTSRFQRMFQDIGVSKDLMKTFRDKQDLSKSCIKDFHMLVLTTGSWPFQQSSDNITLPAELQICVDKFKLFYQSQHQGRLLKWLMHLCKGELRTTYTHDPKDSKKPMMYTLQANTNQIALLNQYNSGLSFSEQELAAATQMGADALKGVLEVMLKSKLLVKDGDKYNLNMAFKNKKLRVNINIPVKAEAKAESEQLHKIIDEDRKMLIQAVIVRVMKTRKRLKHQPLILEAIEQLKSRFKPKVPMLKKCIDILIDKEFLERVEGTRDEYNYLA